MSDVKLSAEVLQLVDDIKAIKIQGATNVAIASMEGMKLWLKSYEQTEHNDFSKQVFLEDIEKVGTLLAWARPNEPLAKNGIKYVKYHLVLRNTGNEDFQSLKTSALSIMEEYLQLIEKTKNYIVDTAASQLKNCKVILTHCHSSTAEKVIIDISKARKGDLQAISPETRPKYQGRITAKNLYEAGVKITMIVDSAVASFIVDDSYLPVDAIIIGVDQINVDGSAINKVGSLGLSLASSVGNKPIYVLGPLLKLDVSTVYNPISIEMRSANEIWPEAPEGLNIINPAFERVPDELVTAYITEFGVLKPKEVYDRLIKEYGWIT